MAAVDEKVKQIIVEQLQVDEAEVTPAQASRKILAPTRSTSSNWSCSSKRPSTSRFPTRTPRRSRPSRTLTDYIEKTPERASKKSK